MYERDDIRYIERAMVLTEIRRTGMHPEMVSELDHYMTGVDREEEDYPEGYTEVDALCDMETRLDDAFGDGCKEPWMLAIRKQLRDAEIALGLAVTAEFMDSRYAQWMHQSIYRHKGATYYWHGSDS